MVEKIWNPEVVKIQATNIISEAIKNTFMNVSFDEGIDEADAYMAMQDATAYLLAVMIQEKEINLVNAIKVTEAVSEILNENFCHFAEKDSWGSPVLLNKICSTYQSENDNAEPKYDPSGNGKIVIIKLSLIDGDKSRVLADIVFENGAKFVCPNWNNPEQRSMFLPCIGCKTMFYDERMVSA